MADDPVPGSATVERGAGAEGTGPADALGFRPQEQGVHLFEVMARGDSRYDLWPARPDVEEPEAPETKAAGGKARPEHPLTVADPLSAGVGVDAPGVDIQRRYLPMVYKER